MAHDIHAQAKAGMNLELAYQAFKMTPSASNWLKLEDTMYEHQSQYQSACADYEARRQALRDRQAERDAAAPDYIAYTYNTCDTQEDF